MITKKERALFAKVGKQGGKIIKEKYGHQHFIKMNKIRWDNYRKEQAEKLSTPSDKIALDKNSKGV